MDPQARNSRPGIRPHSVAFMDFGTNSVRLLVVRFEPKDAYTVLHRLKKAVRLGEGEFSERQLNAAAMQRAVAAARHFAEVARAAAAKEIVAVATAATREALNRDVFLEMVRRETGLDVCVISGREEARLIYLGVTSGIDLGDQQALSIDIGGGSTETSIGTRQEALYLNSLKLGAIRLSDQFLRGETGPIGRSLYDRIKAHVRHEASRTVRELGDFNIDAAIGSSGTIKALADVCVRAATGRSRRNKDVLKYEDLVEGVKMLCSLSLEKRRDLKGLNPARADIIIGGAAIVDALMEDLGIRELQVSDRGLRDGLLTDYLARHGQSIATSST